MDAPNAAMPDAERADEAAIGAMARELIADIESGGLPALTLLMRGARLARGAGIGRIERWLDCELRGYDADAADADELMRLSRRWKDEAGRVGYFEPLPVIESRIALLDERARRRTPEPPPLPEDMDARVVAVQSALAERAAARSEREQRKILAQLGDLMAIRSSVLALLHAFADRMASTHAAPGPTPPPAEPVSPMPETTALSDDEHAMLALADEAAAETGNDDLLDALDQAEAWGEEEGIQPNEDAPDLAKVPGDIDESGSSEGESEADLLPEAMLTDDAALDGLVSALEEEDPEMVDTVVEDWDASIDEDAADLETMSAEELADMLDAALASADSVELQFPEDDAIEPPDASISEHAPESESGSEFEGETEAGIESSPEPAPEPHHETSLLDAIDEVLGQDSNADTEATEPDADTAAPFAPLLDGVEQLGRRMEDADAEEAVSAALECGETLTKFAELLGDDGAAIHDPQMALRAAIEARIADGDSAAALIERVDGIFAQLIEVEIGGDAAVMQQVCEDAVRVMNELLNS